MSSSKFLIVCARGVGILVLGALLYALAHIFALLGNRELVDRIHGTLRGWGLLQPTTQEERIAYVNRHLLLRGLSLFQVTRLVFVYTVWGKRMSFLDDELAELKTAVKSNYLLQIASKDDVGLVLSTTNLLDQFLALALIIRFPVDITKTTYGRIFDPNAPLGPFSAKTHLAAMLGIVIGDMGNDLAILRKIRNGYAHGILPLSLSDKPNSDRCASLRLKTGLSEEIIAACKTPERVMIMRSVTQMMMLLMVLIQRAAVERKIFYKYKDEINEELRAAMKEVDAKASAAQAT